MPLSGHSSSVDSLPLREGFLPFARPDYVQGMILGNDLDSILSALFLSERFAWPIVGFYCDYRHLYHDAGIMDFRERLLEGRYVAIDLDICHLCVPCIGHHILSLDPKDKLAGHTHTLNPNRMRGLAVRHRYGAKYPLSTLHYLRYLFQDDERQASFEFLNWLADSSYLNAQHYGENVKDWVTQQLPLPAFLRWLPLLDLPYFEEKLRETLLSPLEKRHSLFKQGTSKYRSKHLGLNGYQVQFKTPNLPQNGLQSLFDVVAEFGAMPRRALPKQYSLIYSGNRVAIPVAQLPSTGFDAWLEENRVFSYAFVFKDTLNYTSLDI
jgi:hypothetical protein